MKEEELKIIDQFINGFEPWNSNLEFMNKLKADGSKQTGCFYCGIEPAQIKKLRDAVENMRSTLIDIIKDEPI